MKEKSGPPPEFLPALQRALLPNSRFLDYIRRSEFKRLLGKITTFVDQGGMKSLAVLSAEAGEGKTFLIATLALGYAVLLQKRVLIVDTLLGDPEPSALQLRKLYETDLQFAVGYGANPGQRMIDLISPQSDGKEHVQADTVDFMIGRFLEQFRKDYDLILVDTCALTARRKRLIDPIVLAGQVDASILVTSGKSLNPKSLADVKALLTQWQVKVIGVLENRPPKGEPK